MPNCSSIESVILTLWEKYYPRYLKCFRDPGPSKPPDTKTKEDILKTLSEKTPERENVAIIVEDKPEERIDI